MSDIQLFLVDTFTNKIFHGYPAAVCVLKDELNDELLHAIAIENQYQETVFIQVHEKSWNIRWFNAMGEIFSSGHGLLAAAYVLFEGLKWRTDSVEFKTHIGKLQVIRKQEKLIMDYPLTESLLGQVPGHVWQHFSIQPSEIWQNGPDMLVYFEHQEQVEKLQINLDALKNLIAGALVVTAPGEDSDFYVRCFFPKVSPREEIATPAIYSRLVQFWETKSAKKIYLAQQGLMRRSDVVCEKHGDRIWVGGECRFYFRGDLVL